MIAKRFDEEFTNRRKHLTEVSAPRALAGAMLLVFMMTVWPSPALARERFTELKDFKGSNPRMMVAGPKYAYFYYLTRNGPRVVQSDGTKKGTVTLSIPARNIKWLAAAPRRGFATIVTKDKRVQLWVINSASASAKMIHDFGDSRDVNRLNFELHPFTGGVCFIGWDPAAQHEVWCSDGATTKRLGDLAPGNKSYLRPKRLTTLGDRVYFWANRVIYSTRGDKAQRVMDMKHITSISASMGKLFIVGHDGVKNRVFYSEQAGKVPQAIETVKYNVLYQPHSFQYVRDKIIFLAKDQTSGLEPWVSSGRPGSARLIKNIRPGPNEGQSGSNLKSGGVAGGVLYFNGTGPNGNTGLWRTDGTADGTTVVKKRFCYALTHIGDVLYCHTQHKSLAPLTMARVRGGKLSKVPKAPRVDNRVVMVARAKDLLFATGSYDGVTLYRMTK